MSFDSAVNLNRVGEMIIDKECFKTLPCQHSCRFVLLDGKEGIGVLKAFDIYSLLGEIHEKALNVKVTQRKLTSEGIEKKIDFDFSKGLCHFMIGVNPENKTSSEVILSGLFFKTLAQQPR